MLPRASSLRSIPRAAVSSRSRRLLLRRNELAVDQSLGDLDGVERGALAQVLGDDPKHEAVLDTSKQGIAQAEETNHVLFYSEMAFAQMALGRTKEALESIGKAVDLSSDKRRVSYRCVRASLLAQAQRPLMR